MSARLETRPTVHDFQREKHGVEEEVEASSPRDTSAAEKEQGGCYAWLATTDGSVSSLGKGGSTKAAEGGVGRRHSSVGIYGGRGGLGGTAPRRSGHGRL